MLAADKLLLTTQIKKNATELKGKELHLHKQNFESVGTQAALLAGFAVCMIVEFDMPNGVHRVLQGVFYVFATVTLVANLRCVTMTTCISVMGTGLALRGPEGSMVKAVEEMYKQRAAVFRSFAVGIICCCLSMATIAWIKMQPIPAALCNGVLLWALASFVRTSRAHFESFKFDEGETVTLDDILFADAVSKESVAKQLGLGTEQLLRLMTTMTAPKRTPESEL
eukprot:TRINITY_DN49932_c0_g1_i2.p1 TRINITY_DN49932_c0_g1~~TRINITY_DN49932_c0_g1_i2.p1  ORF type:complete len:241 (-),score=39.97 TRINITY_DN49932_c0_g1_i2:172-846(-)